MRSLSFCAFCFIRFSFHAFSYNAYFHSPPSPMTLIYFHSSPSPVAPIHSPPSPIALIFIVNTVQQGWKKPGLKKKPGPVFFLGFFFFGFFGFFCPDERVFRVFFSFTNTFRCIQTLNYNHCY